MHGTSTILPNFFDYQSTRMSNVNVEKPQFPRIRVVAGSSY